MNRFFAFLVCVLIPVLAAAPPRAQGAIDVAIDVAAARHAIDPRIYGVAYADNAALADLRVPLHRWGGNASTRHNWQANATNRSRDWYFESIADGPAVASDAADAFVSRTKAQSGEPIITVPMAGWVAKVGPSRNNLASFSIAKYGPQTGADTQWFPDAGNGISASTNQPITGNDPNDANLAATPAFQRGWVQHLVTRYGLAANGGVRYYALDNEPSIWHATHRDIHPSGATMDEVLSDAVAYASQIKGVDPGALVMGPEEWGWSGYLYSGADQQWGATHGWNNLPDRSSHGNQDYLPWFLSQLRQREATTGRLLDIFSVHYYPQGGEYSNDTSPAMQQRRNRSTRALWDPTYVDESWIGTQVQLVRRLKSWASTYYPGTRVGITEYNWGAEGHINGATTQADILGVFGREGLDIATFWTIPAASTPTYKAIKMYRNYDGAGSGFGDVSVSAVAPNPDTVSAFAAQRSGDRALTIVAINKDLSAAASVNFRIANFTPASAAQVWRLTSSNAITRQPDSTVSTSTLAATLPVQSITMFVVPMAAAQGGPSAPTNLRIVNGSASSTLVASGGTPQSTAVNTAFGTSLKAMVRDSAGNAVSGASVTFTAPASGASARFSGAFSVTAFTDVTGVATAPTLTANGTAGSYTVSATASGVSGQAAFALTNGSTTLPGGTWVNVTPPGWNSDPNYPGSGDNFGFQQVLVDPVRPSDLYTFTNYQGVWKSTDFGLTWTMISTGTNSDAILGGRNWGAAIDSSRSRNPGTPPTIYTQAGYSKVGKMGIWKSTDGGVNWTYAWSKIYDSNGVTDITTQVWTDVQGLAIDPNNNQHLLAVSHGNTQNGTYDHYIFETTNGGTTWINRGSPAGHTHCAVNFVTSTTWIATAEGWGPGSLGTFVTTNSGASWTNVGQYGKAHGNVAVHYVDGNGTLFIAAMEGIYKGTSPYLSYTKVDSTSTQNIVGTANFLYASFGWASLGTVAPNLRRALAASGTTWDSTYTSPPSNMTNGAMGGAVTFDASSGKNIIIMGAWHAGLWRYVE